MVEAVVVVEAEVVMEVGGVGTNPGIFAKILLESAATRMNTTLSKSSLMRICVIANVLPCLTRLVGTMPIVPTGSVSIK